MRSEPTPAPRGGHASATGRFTGLELLFDLVFVFTVAQIAAVYRDEPSWRNAVTAVLVFVPVWWAWVGITFATDRFADDDAPAQLLVIAAAAATGVMGLAIPSVPGSGEIAFAFGYAAARLVLASYYLRVRSDASDGGRLAGFYAVGFASVGGLWLLSTVLPPPARLTVWGVATAFDVTMPRWADRRGRLIAVDRSHLAERCAAFVIIVIGEQVVDTLTIAADGDMTGGPRRGVLAAAGVLAVALWWGFFERGSWQRRYRSLEGTRSGQSAATVCAYLHFPLVVGITAAAAGVQLALERGSDGTGLAAASAVTAGVGAYLLSMNAMSWALHVPRTDSLATTRSVLCTGLGLLVVLGHGWPPTLFLAAVAAVLVVHAVAGQRRGASDRRQPLT